VRKVKEDNGWVQFIFSGLLIVTTDALLQRIGRFQCKAKDRAGESPILYDSTEKILSLNHTKARSKRPAVLDGATDLGQFNRALRCD